MFLDREDAAAQLMEHLQDYWQHTGIVLALPRGGVPVGRYIADHLQWPLDVVVVKKIGHPLNPEYAVGAVSLKGYAVNKHLNLPQDYIAEEVNRLNEVIREKYKLYTGSYEPVEVSGKIVLLVDDGMATGSTVLGAIDLLRKQNPREIVVAVPVASTEAYRKVARKADKVICLSTPEDFQAVGQYYRDFSEVTDEEVIALLQRNGYNS